MALYYLPVLIRSDRYFVMRLESGFSNELVKKVDPVEGNGLSQYAPLDNKLGTAVSSVGEENVDFNFVIYAEDRALTPLLTIEEPERIVLNQMAPSEKQDIPLSECNLSLQETSDGVELIIKKGTSFSVEPFSDEVSGLRLDYSADTRRILLGFYKYKVAPTEYKIRISLFLSETEKYSGVFLFKIAHSHQCQRVVIDFGSEASQIGYRNCSPQSPIMLYDILGNIVSRLNTNINIPNWRRDDFLNVEPDQPMLYRSFYALKKNISEEQRKNFPFNFTNSLGDDEIRLFITKQEVSATQFAFRDEYEIIPNLKLGIEKSVQLTMGDRTEDYSIRSHKKELISAVLLRLLRLMIGSKPEFQQGGIIVTLLVPNIYTQHDVFELLNELKSRTNDLLASLNINYKSLAIEYETISESDAAFMGFQQTQPYNCQLVNGEIALVIDCGKGTTDISMLLADDNENYSSFYRTGFAGAGNVLLCGFVEDFLTLVLNAIPGNNNISVKDFINKQVSEQALTADVLNFIQLMEDQKKRFRKLPAIGVMEFSKLTEATEGSERSIGNLYKDQSTLLQYAEEILKGRNIRWDDEVTGIIHKATDCIASCIINCIKDVITKDIKKRIKMVMLSGRAFYFDSLRRKLEEEMNFLLGEGIKICSVSPGRAINNKNVAIHGAFSGAYKITDFTGIPIDKKEGLSKNSDVLNNNLFLYKGIKIEPGNDILYNASVVRRNHLDLKSFKNRTVDIYFTRDNIYLRLMENQQVKEVRSLSSILTSVTDSYSPVLDLKEISMFPSYTGELVSIDTVYQDVMRERKLMDRPPVRKRNAVFHFFNY